MRRDEWVLVGLAYVCVAVGGLALMHAMRWESEGMALVAAVIIAIELAAYFFHRRTADHAPAGLRLLLGGMLAVLCIVACVFAQQRWHVFALPEVVIPIHALGCAIFPMLLFNTFRKSLPKTPPVETPLPMSARVAIAVGSLVIALAGVAVVEYTPAAPAPPRVVVHRFPGVAITLPDWTIAVENVSRYERGEFKLTAPGPRGRFATFRWETGDVPDEMLEPVLRNLGMTIAKESTTVAGHAALRRHLFAGAKDGFVTTWSCPEDHRWLCFITFIGGERDELRHQHESILSSVRCHTEGKRELPPPVVAVFIPPEGWVRAMKEVADDGYLGPNGELVMIAESIAGKHQLFDADAAAANPAVGTMVKSLLSLKSADTPTRIARADAQGHSRLIWSCTGKAEDGATVQVELMAWHCPQRDATFMVWYMTQENHPVDDAVKVLMSATCH